ncbi:MAG: type II toxin-antitoxin system RelE/ParE family toxin [Armatimonadetes bacterium]|nr:type II toxin-antitoxin system RelE/ParE family toxin [Armatimonadota bacterium]
MALRVKWTETAWADPESVADYIAQDSPYYAAAFVRETRDAARSLARLSKRGRTVPEFDNPTVREIFVRDYRLIYHLTPRTVYVIGFIHGARDLRSLWEREGGLRPDNGE